MTQLTFDGAIHNESNSKGPAGDTTLPSSESWYKGRTLSHSSIHLYRSCPQKWKFRYLDKIPEKPRSFFSFGKSVHSGLEFLFTNIQDGLPTLEAVLSDYKAHWIREGYDSPQQEKWFFQEGEKIIRGFYAKHQGDMKNVFQVEFKFTIDIEGVPVTGFIDRIDSTPSGGLALLDYKTGKAFDKVRARQEPQLTLYQIAVKKLLSREVETVGLYHLNSLTAHIVPAHSEAQETEVKANVVEAARGINENKFDPKPEPSGQCQWCDYLQVCPAFAGKRGPRSFDVFTSDSASELADRLGRLDAKLSELSQERRALEQSLHEHFAKRGCSSIDGKYFSVFKENEGDHKESSIGSKPRGETA